MEIDSKIGHTMARIAHAKTDEERAAWRKRLSALGKAKARFLAQVGSYCEHLEDEETYAEQAQIVGGYSR